LFHKGLAIVPLSAQGPVLGTPARFPASKQFAFLGLLCQLRPQFDSLTTNIKCWQAEHAPKILCEASPVGSAQYPCRFWLPYPFSLGRSFEQINWFPLDSYELITLLSWSPVLSAL